MTHHILIRFTLEYPCISTFLIPAILLQGISEYFSLKFCGIFFTASLVLKTSHDRILNLCVLVELLLPEIFCIFLNLIDALQNIININLHILLHKITTCSFRILSLREMI